LDEADCPWARAISGPVIDYKLCCAAYFASIGCVYRCDLNDRF
jgi:hypothetical protein